MDFNDLNKKLIRLYISLGEQYEEDISSNIIDSHTLFDDGHFEHRTTFGKNEPEENENIIINAVHAISSLKDIIKQKLWLARKSPKLYEKLIDENLSIALITDLDNKNKHGDPLRDPLRSGKDPRIVNIEQVLHAQGITKVSCTTSFITGKTVVNDVMGNVKLEVVADIIDSDGSLIMPLNKMIKESIEVIQGFITTYNLLN